MIWDCFVSLFSPGSRWSLTLAERCRGSAENPTGSVRRHVVSCSIRLHGGATSDPGTPRKPEHPKNHRVGPDSAKTSKKAPEEGNVTRNQDLNTRTKEQMEEMAGKKLNKSTSGGLGLEETWIRGKHQRTCK